MQKPALLVRKLSFATKTITNCKVVGLSTNRRRLSIPSVMLTMNRRRWTRYANFFSSTNKENTLTLRVILSTNGRKLLPNSVIFPNISFNGRTLLTNSVIISTNRKSCSLVTTRVVLCCSLTNRTQRYTNLVTRLTNRRSRHNHHSSYLEQLVPVSEKIVQIIYL